MKNYIINKSAFTLIELLVSMTIFSVIMISVIQVYINTTQVGAKTELTRSMQENLKNITEDIANEVRRGRLGFYENNLGISTCNRNEDIFFQGSPATLKSQKQICIGDVDNTDPNLISNSIIYGLGTKSPADGSFHFDDTDCGLITGGVYKQCYFLKKQGSSIYPISNNLVNIKDLQFTVFPGKTAYVTMNFRIEPTKKGGVNARIIENTKIDFQTSFSERFVSIK